MPETAVNVSALLDRLPGLQDGKVPPVDPALAGELLEQLRAGGREAVVGLVDELREVDDGSDWKARFLLQAMVVDAGRPGRERARRRLAGVLLDEAASDRPPPVRTFLAARLRLVAGAETVDGLVPLLASEHPPLADAAAAALVSVGAPAREPLEQAQRGAQGRQLELIRNALPQIDRRRPA